MAPVVVDAGSMFSRLFFDVSYSSLSVSPSCCSGSPGRGWCGPVWSEIPRVFGNLQFSCPALSLLNGFSRQSLEETIFRSTWTPLESVGMVHN